MSARLILTPILNALEEANDRAAPPLGSVVMRLFSDGSGSIYVDDGGRSEEERELYRFDNFGELRTWALAPSREARVAIESGEQASRGERDERDFPKLDFMFLTAGGVH